MSRARPAAVLSVGRLYCDLIFTDVPRLPTLGTEVYAGGFGIHAGGGAFITAAHLAALGHPTALGATLPGPPLAAAVLPEIEAAGLDLTLSRPMAAGTEPQVTVALACGGDRAFVTRRSDAAFPDITAAQMTALGIGHLHIGELASLVEMPGILAQARAAGVSVSLDCSWDETLTAADIGGLVGKIDVFLPNEAEAERMHALGVPKPFAPLTVVKRGAAGCVAITAEGTVEARACAVEARDTTGAGDAFNAGFLSAWLTGTPLADCLAAGNARGALAIAGRGGFQRAPDAPRRASLGRAL